MAFSAVIYLVRAATTSSPPNAIGERLLRRSRCRGVDDVALDLLQVLRRRADGPRSDDLGRELAREDRALHASQKLLRREAAAER